MRLDLHRQPLGLALFLLLSYAAVGFARLQWAPLPVEAATALPTPLGIRVDAFAAAYPVWSLLLGFCAALWCGVVLWRITVRHALFETRSTLLLPLYGAVACAWVLSEHLLRRELCMLLLVLFVSAVFGGFRRRYSFDSIFRAAVALGILPLLSAPALLLWLLLPIVLIATGRSLREVLVAIVGLLLPVATVLYLTWAFHGTSGASRAEVWNALHALAIPDATLHALPLPWLILGAFMGTALLGGIVVFFILRSSMRFKARRMWVCLLYTVGLTLSICFLPSATTMEWGMAALVGVPFLSLLFTRVRGLIAPIVYLVLLTASMGLNLWALVGA